MLPGFNLLTITTIISAICIALHIRLSADCCIMRKNLLRVFRPARRQKSASRNQMLHDGAYEHVY